MRWNAEFTFYFGSCARNAFGNRARITTSTRGGQRQTTIRSHERIDIACGKVRQIIDLRGTAHYIVCIIAMSPDAKRVSEFMSCDRSDVSNRGQIGHIESDGGADQLVTGVKAVIGYRAVVRLTVWLELDDNVGDRSGRDFAIDQ